MFRVKSYCSSYSDDSRNSFSYFRKSILSPIKANTLLRNSYDSPEDWM
jgi:hypothetical protein